MQPQQCPRRPPLAPPSSCEDPFPPPQLAGGFPAPARGRGWMQVSKIMLHHACLVLYSLAQRCSGWGPRGSPPEAELPLARCRCAWLWALGTSGGSSTCKVPAAALHPCTQREAAASAPGSLAKSGGSPAGHPHHPKKPSRNPTGTEPSGEGQFHTTGSWDRDKDPAGFPPGSGYFAAALRFHLFSQPSHVAAAQDPSPEPGTSPYLLLAWSALEERR